MTVRNLVTVHTEARTKYSNQFTPLMLHFVEWGVRPCKIWEQHIMYEATQQALRHDSAMAALCLRRLV